MESKNITVNGQEVTVFANGWIEKPYRGRLKLTSGASTRRDYRQTWVGSKKYLMHRLVAMAFLPDYSKNLHCDHIDGNPSNNSAENIRMATALQNPQGYCKKRKGASSVYRGVSFHRKMKKWTANIQANYKPKFLGYFDCEKEAARAYNSEAINAGFQLEALNQI
tara:strand:- start:285 stop:779 length:495 start_codon:yes stop_codon:yes gene_type:complete